MDVLQPARLDHAGVRNGGKGLLALALMASRNRTLAWMTAIEEALGTPALTASSHADVDPPLWTLAHLGWFQEHWIVRHVQRRRGAAADVDAPRVGASVFVEPGGLGDAAPRDPAGRRAAAAALPDAGIVRERCAALLEQVLETLEAEPEEDDASLWAYRLAVLHEDRLAEQFAVLAQTLGFAVAAEAGPIALPAARAPLVVPATRWRLGDGASGFVRDIDTGDEPVAVPDFEIDAQPVSWAQYGDFVEDGGYDEPAHWSAAGWAWLAREARRTPRHVEQLRHGVLQRRFGRVQRVPPGAPVVHVARHEAEAWCRWAGRRLPAEVEWEVAATRAAARGFRVGTVREWTASTLRPFDGWRPGPRRALVERAFGVEPVLRGWSAATPATCADLRRREHAAPEADAGFVGFRTCAAEGGT